MSLQRLNVISCDFSSPVKDGNSWKLNLQQHFAVRSLETVRENRFNTTETLFIWIKEGKNTGT